MNKSKIFMIISIAILVVTIIVSSVTFAWYVWSTSSEEETRIVTSMGAARVFFDGGASITGVNLKPTATKEEGIVKSIAVKASKETAYKISFNLYLDIISLDNGLKDVSFKYALYKEGQADAVVTGNFLNLSTEECTTNSTNHIVLVNDETIATTVQEYKLYIWIDGNMSNPGTMHSQNFSFKLHADGQNAVIGETLSDKIINLYNNTDKAVVTNNNISYNYAKVYDNDGDDNTSGGLMNDRLGTASVSADGGNIRYYGANPNNYVYFNCSDYSNQSSSTCELWRIIGVFDGKVKIMRNGSIGTIAWDQDKNNGDGKTTYNNDWSNSSLQQFLNGKYYDRGTTTTHPYYSGASGGTTTNINLSTVGIKNDATRGAISETTWYLRGWDNGTFYSDQMYNYERSTGNLFITTQPDILLSKIAIIYASDFGYAADFSSCKVALTSYSNSSCTGTSWIRKIFVSSGTWWLLSPSGDDSTDAGVIDTTGKVDYDANPVYATNRNVVPVLHLNSNLFVESGNGSIETPYNLVIM